MIVAQMSVRHRVQKEEEKKKKRDRAPHVCAHVKVNQAEWREEEEMHIVNEKQDQAPLCMSGLSGFSTMH